MSSRNLLLITVAVLIAGFTAFSLNSRLKSAPPAEVAQAPAVRILVAKHTIAPGTFVRAGEDIDWAGWPAEGLQPYHVKEGPDALNSFQGAVARRSIKAGEPITSAELIKPGTGGFLPAVLEPGMRAVSIAVTATSGNAGFIFPGDRVDLILTHRMRVLESAANEAEEAVVSETFVENVRVVAVDQQLDNPENKAILAKTVTVEVTPKQAEKIQVAGELGKLSLSLRSLSDSEKAKSLANGEDAKLAAGGTGGPYSEVFDPEGVTANVPVAQSFTRDFELSPVLERTGTTNARVRVIRGEESNKVEFYRDK